MSLSEPGAEFSDDILLNDSPRSISLVPGRTYSISCEGTEWHRNGQLVTATTPVIDGVSGVYVVSNGDATILMLQLFSESLVGQYFCRDDAGAEFIINISTGAFFPLSIAVYILGEYSPVFFFRVFLGLQIL